MLHVLSSGSKGNCYCIETSEELIFIDAGVTGAVINRHFSDNNISLTTKKISLLITHEHTDHISGLTHFINKLSPSIFASKGTLEMLSKQHNINGKVLEPMRYIELANFAVTALPVAHDAADTTGFLISTENGNTAIMTDLGHVTEAHLDKLQDADSLILECNHDKDMLANGRYHPKLKRRVASARGHLSNQDAMHVLASLSGGNLRKAFLAHISEENNDYSLLDKFASFTKDGFDIDTYVLRQKTEYRWCLSPFTDAVVCNGE